MLPQTTTSRRHPTSHAESLHTAWNYLIVLWNGGQVYPLPLYEIRLCRNKRETDGKHQRKVIRNAEDAGERREAAEAGHQRLEIRKLDHAQRLWTIWTQRPCPGCDQDFARSRLWWVTHKAGSDPIPKLLDVPVDSFKCLSCVKHPEHNTPGSGKCKK